MLENDDRRRQPERREQERKPGVRSVSIPLL